MTGVVIMLSVVTLVGLGLKRMYYDVRASRLAAIRPPQPWDGEPERPEFDDSEPPLL